MFLFMFFIVTEIPKFRLIYFVYYYILCITWHSVFVAFKAKNFI